MSGSIFTPSTLMTTYLPDNTTETITPAYVRNFCESAFGVPTSAQSASYAILVTDRGTVINVTSATPVNITVNSGVLAANHQFGIRQLGAGQVTVVAGSGLTRQSSTGTFATRTTYSLISVQVHSDGTTLLVDGDLS